PGQIGGNATAILESPCFDLSGQSSATFSFQNHMYGTAVGSLTVEATDNDQNWTQLWTQSGNQGNQWNAVDLDLSAYVGGTVKLRITGTTGNGWSSDIAIDDLAVTTSGGATCDTPTGLSVTAVGTTTASIDWNDVSGAVDYTVRWRAVGTPTWSQGNVTTSGGSFSNLIPATNYETQVSANCGGSSSAFTSSLNFTTDPASSGGCNDVVDSNDFESGWGIWNDGGSDARRSANDAAYSNGTYSIRLRDNTSTSTMTTDNINLTAYDEITVDFSYYARSMDNVNEDFWLQISTNGGSSYTTVAEWNQGDEFVNDTRYDDQVTITGPFPSNTRLRFRCDASGNSDWVYIDDVVITGCTTGSSARSPNQALTVSKVQNLNEQHNTITTAPSLNNLNNGNRVMGTPMQMKLFPNPVSNELNIQYQIPVSQQNIQLIVTDLNGRTVQLRTLAGDIVRQQVQVDVSQLSNGFYFVHLITAEDRLSKKFIVQHR
ncbi:MAG: T9SS type A sorting domain-containing protein, partial [Bacteroidota bacterium]